MADEQPLPPLPVFVAGQKVCGNCKLWSPISVEAAKGWVGQCRVQPSRGLFVPTAPVCDAFAPRGGAVAAKPEPEPERIKRIKNIAPVVVRRREDGTPALPMRAQVVSSRGDEQVDFGDLGIVSAVQHSATIPMPGTEPQAVVAAPAIAKQGVTMTRAELMDIFLEATGQAEVSLAPKWEGGVCLFTDMASEMLYPILPIYLKSIGFSIVLIGILEGVAEATAGLSKGYFGKLSDNSGKRVPFVQLGYTLSTISKPMMALFVYPLWIFFARTVAHFTTDTNEVGCGFSILIPAFFLVASGMALNAFFILAIIFFRIQIALAFLGWFFARR